MKALHIISNIKKNKWISKMNIDLRVKMNHYMMSKKIMMKKK